jgi:hypothetical protein
MYIIFGGEGGGAWYSDRYIVTPTFLITFFFFLRFRRYVLGCRVLQKCSRRHMSRWNKNLPVLSFFVFTSRDPTYVVGPKLVALDQYPAFHEDSVPYLAFLKFGLQMWLTIAVTAIARWAKAPCLFCNVAGFYSRRHTQILRNVLIK